MKFRLVKPGLKGLKAAMPLSALNSVRDFSASGHACGKLKKNIGVLFETPELR